MIPTDLQYFVCHIYERQGISNACNGQRPSHLECECSSASRRLLLFVEGVVETFETSFQGQCSHAAGCFDPLFFFRPILNVRCIWQHAFRSFPVLSQAFFQFFLQHLHGVFGTETGGLFSTVSVEDPEARVRQLYLSLFARDPPLQFHCMCVFSFHEHLAQAMLHHDVHPVLVFRHAHPPNQPTSISLKLPRTLSRSNSGKLPLAQTLPNALSPCFTRGNSLPFCPDWFFRSNSASSLVPTGSLSLPPSLSLNLQGSFSLAPLLSPRPSDPGTCCSTLHLVARVVQLLAGARGCTTANSWTRWSDPGRTSQDPTPSPVEE
mmetsp:Transcript_4588/g.29072  ORF Transcript_4588/g.29072 Transcript_4588/m.29072 type:complete len:320 (+) Transcript_4588:2570-3529(+)